MKKKEFPLAVYGAGAIAAALFNVLKQSYNIVCFCDSDKRKQGQIYCGLPVLSFEDALSKYSDMHIYVATDDDWKFEIMENVIQLGFPKERIENYEPYKKYKSCWNLETRIGLSEKAMLICPSSFGKHQSPVIPYTGDPIKNIEVFKKVRDTIIDAVATGDKECDALCMDCPELKERYWAVNRRIKSICFSIKHKCNFHCCYCVEDRIDKSALTGSEHLDEVLDTMREMSAQGMIDKHAIIAVAPTEISVHPYKEKILEDMKQYVCQFTTNASVYIDSIAQSLKMGGKIFCSLDAGTRETFLKVKGLDMFPRVCENLKRYAEAGAVELKYIFLPGINDNEQDVDGFIAVCDEICAVAVHISRNTMEFGTLLPEHTLRMIVRMIQKATEKGLPVNCSPRVFLPEEYDFIQNNLSPIQ